MLDTIRKTLQLIAVREHPWRWVGLTLLAFTATGLEMLGALLVFLLAAMVADPTGQIRLPLVGDLRAAFADFAQEQLILVLLVALAIFFLVRAAFHVYVVYTQHRIAQGFGADLSVRLMLGYLGMDYRTYVRRNTAELIRNTTSAIDRVVVNAVLPLIKVIADGLLALGLLAVLLAVAPAATGLAVVIIGGSQVVLLLFVQPRLKRQGQAVHFLTRATLKSLQQALIGFRDIRLLGRERFFGNQFAGYRRDLARTTVHRGTALALPPVIMELALVGFILVFFGLAIATGTATEQVLSILGVFAYAGLRLQPILNRVVGGLNEIRFATASVDEIASELAAVDEQALPAPQTAQELAWQTLSFERVYLAYVDDGEPALRDIDLVIRRGETIGICGPTGGGKTTLVDLVAGLLEPTSGRVRIDGTNLAELAPAWQSRLGVVSQMGFLTDDSIRRNVALGIPDEEIDDDAVLRALRLAQLEDFARSLPYGLDTPVGERGIRMSGGQRQRITIARALYRQVDFLIFDEGTSALDNATERQFMEALTSLPGDYTILLVAHRLSTVEQCDRILYVEDGRIAASGTYRGLLAEVPGFRQLVSQSHEVPTHGPA